MQRRRRTRGSKNLPRSKKTGGPAVNQEVKTILSDYERQVQVDEGLRRVWFKKVLTLDEVSEVIKSYCRKINAYTAQDLASSSIINDLTRDLERMLFLIKGIR